ncbi:MAG: PHP domain-containing protein [Bacilli bacterium]|nr:PHP domain-containing protein [Bacilli bacterium]
MIDLHVHTTYSDGLDSLTDILAKAETIGLKSLSITDHDTCCAYNELENIDYQNIFTGTIIKGIEISSKYSGHKIELLAYNFDNHHLINKLIVRDNYRSNENMHFIIEQERIKLIHKFKNLGFVVDNYFLDNLFIDAFESSLYNSILDNNDNNYVKDKLKNNYYDSGYEFYRKCVTSPETPFYIDYSVLNMGIGEICEIIHSFDGLVFLAHPYLYGMKDFYKSLYSIYKRYSIDGIECYYNGFNKEQINNIKEFALNNNLLISGGSDYHAKSGYKNQLGFCMQGKSTIPDIIIDNWNVDIKPVSKKRHFL